MGDPKSTLEMARKELEDMYLGIPDESVNLTFQDFIQVKKVIPVTNKNGSSSNVVDVKIATTLANKSPSFNRDLVKGPYHYHHAPPSPSPSPILMHNTINDDSMHSHRGDMSEGQVRYDNVSHDVSVYKVRGGGRRRLGIPHSNICTICSTYIYIFRHRCLVCGRVYCRKCVGIGMGDMSEGRKCIECLGRRFSQRYIGRAGKMGCCGTWSWSWSWSRVKQAELKWAEKGSRRNGRGAGSVMMSTSMAPVAHSPYTLTHHHFSL